VTSASTGEKAAFEVDTLGVTFGQTTAVHDVSFTAGLGRITLLVGPNGAGKTTTLSCLEGFIRPDRGTVRVLGRDPAAHPREVYRTLGVMLQQGGVHTGLRPLEVLRMYAAFYDHARNPDELLDLVGLTDRARNPWRSLSGGEQQRLSLALALVGRPRVAILDEPTAGVDASGKRLLRDLIRSLRNEGLGLLVTTHDLADVEELADHIVIIDHGRVISAGTPDEILSADGSDDLRFRARPGLPIDDLRRAVNANVTEPEPGRYVIDASPDPSKIAALTTWLAAHDELLGDLTAGRRKLEDVVLRLTAEADNDADDADPSDA